jgi:GNAT superfamily N-acetyltransferase
MTLQLRDATLQDSDLLLEFMAGFNQEEGIAFEPEVYRDRINAAFQFPQFVKVWLVTVNSAPVGYAIMTFTFSFEFGGIQAAIDEVYLCSTQRRKGLGTLVLELLEREAANSGAKALWGDISDEKPWLYTFYERAGFNPYPYRPYSKPL